MGVASEGADAVASVWAKVNTCANSQRVMILQHKAREARAPTPDSDCAAYKTSAADSRDFQVDVLASLHLTRTHRLQTLRTLRARWFCRGREMTCRDSDIRSCEGWETWDYCGIDVDRLGERAVHYARKAGATAKTIGAGAAVLGEHADARFVLMGRAEAAMLIPALPAVVYESQNVLQMLIWRQSSLCESVRSSAAEALKVMLNSKVGRRIASLSQKQLFAELINDAYKPKMHKIYSQFMRGAKVDFALNIRKSTA